MRVKSVCRQICQTTRKRMATFPPQRWHLTSSMTVKPTKSRRLLFHLRDANGNEGESFKTVIHVFVGSQMDFCIALNFGVGQPTLKGHRPVHFSLFQESGTCHISEAPTPLSCEQFPKVFKGTRCCVQGRKSLPKPSPDVRQQFNFERSRFPRDDCRPMSGDRLANTRDLERTLTRRQHSLPWKTLTRLFAAHCGGGWNVHLAELLYHPSYQLSSSFFLFSKFCLSSCLFQTEWSWNNFTV